MIFETVVHVALIYFCNGILLFAQLFSNHVYLSYFAQKCSTVRLLCLFDFESKYIDQVKNVDRKILMLKKAEVQDVT